MIKRQLLIGFIFFHGGVFAQNFTAKYNFAMVSSSSGPVDPTPAPAPASVTCGSFSAIGTGTNSSAAGRFSFTNWGIGATDANDNYATFTGSINPGKYYEVNLAATPGYSLHLDSITFSMRRSATGVRNFSVRWSADTFANNLPSRAPTGKVSVLSGNVFYWSQDGASTSSDQKSCSAKPSPSAFVPSLSLRFYAWNAESTGGTFSIDSVVIIGSVTNTTFTPPPDALEEYGISDILHPYPSPSPDGFFHLETTTAFTRVTVIDTGGHTVHAGKANTTMLLDLHELPDGFYFVILQTANGACSRKIQIMKN
jgi:hypothetical protein